MADPDGLLGASPSNTSLGADSLSESAQDGNQQTDGTSGLAADTQMDKAARKVAKPKTDKNAKVHKSTARTRIGSGKQAAHQETGGFLPSQGQGNGLNLHGVLETELNLGSSSPSMTASQQMALLQNMMTSQQSHHQEQTFSQAAHGLPDQSPVLNQLTAQMQQLTDSISTIKAAAASSSIQPPASQKVFKHPYIMHQHNLNTQWLNDLAQIRMILGSDTRAVAGGLDTLVEKIEKRNKLLELGDNNPAVFKEAENMQTAEAMSAVLGIKTKEALRLVHLQDQSKQKAQGPPPSKQARFNYQSPSTMQYMPYQSAPQPLMQPFPFAGPYSGPAYGSGYSLHQPGRNNSSGGFRPRQGQGQGRDRRNDECHICHARGHWKTECPQRGGAPPPPRSN